MEHENRRQWERFRHPTELQLTAAGHVLPVKLVDVSRHGMQVVAPVLLHVGDEVAASLPATLPTPQAASAVRGRVCWTAPARSAGSPQTRAGIVFVAPLAEAEPQRAVADPQAGTSVIVQFSGAMPQVMARAFESEQGLRLRFTLPALSEGSTITLHSQTDIAKEMRVVRARLDDDGSQIELLVEPSPETRQRRFLQYDKPAPTAIAAETPPRLAGKAAGAEEPRRPKRRMYTGLGIGLSLTAAIWITARVRQPHESTTRPSSEVAAEAITRSVSPPIARAPELVTAPDKRAAPARHTSASAAVSGTAPQPSAAATVVEPAASKPATNVEPAPPKPRAGTLAVSSTKDTSEIFVPVTGSLAGMETKIWTDPPALVVEIPHGQVALARKHYDIQKDGVVGISVGRPGGVTQVRVYVNSILSQYNATAAPGGVSIRIKRDLQSLP